jgi:23S rRNA (adenine2503-C2)-methyltransferase
VTAKVLLNLYDLTRPELTELITGWEFSPVHAARLWRYLYWECVGSLADMTELPAKVLTRLKAETSLGVLPIALETDSRDGFTRKYLLSLTDAERIETVLMRFTGRVTACISSQVGCAMGCVFCATGQMGYTRHLTTGEIVAQAVHVQRVLRSPVRSECNPLGYTSVPPKTKVLRVEDTAPPPKCNPLGYTSASSANATTARLRNIVLMGMGEPLHNYDAVMKAVDILTDGNGLSLGADHITLSTVGVVPGILRLAKEKKAIRLAVSLHAATQAGRAALVPAARKWQLDELMAACRTYSETTGRRIFYEWTLIEGENDSEQHARDVGNLLRGLPAQVNLIPLNPTTGYDGAPTRSEAAKRFQKILADEFGIPSTVRQRRGIDIAAGCGQLAIAEKES